MRSYLDAWKRRPRGARIADATLGLTIVVLTIALVVNALADVRTTRRHQVDERVMTNYLINYAGGPSQFGSQTWVSVRRGSDFVCAFLRHGNGGLCLRISSTSAKSRKVLLEFRCINLPPVPKHVKKWHPPPPPKGQHWCPPHPKKVT